MKVYTLMTLWVIADFTKGRISKTKTPCKGKADSHFLAVVLCTQCSAMLHS